MEMEYTSKMGTLKLYGSGGNTFTICSVDGLEPCEKSRSLKSYVGEDGSYQDSSQYISRVITISGDLKCNDNFSELFRNAARILSVEGVLTVKNGDRIRCINVNSASVSIGKRYKTYNTFVIQMTCDYPHFRDINNTYIPIFLLTKYLSSTTVLPAVLSERTSAGIINNIGDLKTFPKITIRKNYDTVGENNISIRNITTDKEIVLKKELSEDETITIDTKNRTIISSIDGNILSVLDFYSSLSEFRIECGINEIGVSVDGNYADIDVTVEFCNEYLEAL